MAKYYRIVDDVHVPGRWHLGTVRLSDGAVLHLLDGQSSHLASSAIVEVTHGGRPLECCVSAFGVPIASKSLADAIQAVDPEGIEQVPITIERRSGYVALNARRIIDCVDESRSTFTKWAPSDPRPELAGSYRSLSPLHLDPSRIPANAHLFRIKGWLVGLIASSEMRASMESAGCEGAKFLDVT